MKFKNEMTSLERMKAYFENKEVDRLPLAVYLGEPAAKFLDIAAYDYYHNADNMVAVEEFCYRRFGHDGVSIRSGLHGFAEAMGSQLDFPKHGLAMVAKPFLENEENHSALEPADPRKHGRLPIFLEGLEKLKSSLGDEVGVSASIPGPFTTLSSLRGAESLMKDLYTKPEQVFSWLDIITESFYRYIDESSKLGVGVSLAEPMGSGSLISPKMFRTFVKPYLSRCSDRILEKTGKRPALHICGQTEKVLKDMVEIGISSLSLDNVVDMEVAKREVGKEICLVGNVKPVETIGNGTEDEIYTEVKGLIDKLHDNPKGYIMSPGCQLPMNVGLDKVDMYVEATCRYGSFPIESSLKLK